jgi:MFS family permease
MARAGPLWHDEAGNEETNDADDRGTMNAPVTLPDPPNLVPPRNLFRLVVPPMVLPVFLAAADSTIVATALPSIAATFGEVRNLSWVVVANLIASTVAAPAYGRLGDLFGRRGMMQAALAVFMAASLLCALAPSFGVLLLGRVLQGLGGGGLMTMSQALVGEIVPPRQRGSYQGFITQLWGWHAVFLCYLPLGAIAMLLVLRLPPSRHGTGRAGFDAAGMLLLTVAIVPMLLAVSEIQRLDPTAIPRLSALVAVSLAAFAALLWQQKRSRNPLLAFGLMKIPSFWRADLMAACSGASLTALMTFLPIYLQVVTGATPAQTGIMLIPLSGAVSSGAVVTGWLISRSGRTAIFPAVGLAITAVTLVILAIWAPDMTRVQLSWVLAIGAVCQGTAMITAQITVQTVCGANQLGTAAGSVQLARSLGSAFGAAVAGAVLFGLLTTMHPTTAEMFSQMVRLGPGVLDSLPPARQVLVQADIASAFRGVFLTVACFSCIIVACAATMPLRRL